MAVSRSYCQVVGVVFCVLHLDALNESPTLIPFRSEVGYTRYGVRLFHGQAVSTFDQSTFAD